MKTFLPALIFLFLTLTGCDKRCEVFTGTWESNNYNAYVNIRREGDAFLVSIKEKNGELSWISKKIYVMHYDNGMLRSNETGFKTIRLNTKANAIRINEEDDEWHKQPNHAK